MTDPAPLRIATAQASATPGDIAANAAAGAELVVRAAEYGARVLVLPELYLCGYDLATVGVRPDDCDLTVDALDDPRLESLRDAAADAGVLTLVGASVRRDAYRTISLLAIEQRIRVVYDKQHLCGDEVTHFVAGKSGSLLDVDGWPLGLGICYDGSFPEHARAYADAGALAYVASVAFTVGGQHRRDLYYRARAVENTMFSVVSGLVGRCGDADYGGGTAVYDPQGRPVDRVEEGAAGLAIATLDVADVRATRAEHTMYADHRGDLGPMLRY